MPTLHEVKIKKNHFNHIKPEDLEEAKRELLAYHNKNKMVRRPLQARLKIVFCKLF